MDAKCRRAALAPERVVAKLPATLEAIRLAAALTEDGIRCALTGVYSPAQALLAHEVGCVWIIPYVDRAARHSAGGVVLELAAILARLQSSTRILAASLKSAPAGGRSDPPRRTRHHRAARGASRPPRAPTDRIRRASRRLLGVVSR